MIDSENTSTAAIPVTVVTGFLGSGKTTFLLEWARQEADRHFVYLVNEFSRAGVDPALLEQRSNNPVFSVLGGSIFCDCRVGAFLDSIQIIRDLHSRRTVERLVIETSGMAVPSEIEDLLSKSKLDGAIRVQHVVCLVSTLQAPKLAKTLPAFLEQIESASLVILNKTDLASPEQIAAARQIIATANPTAPILESQFAKIGSFPANLNEPPPWLRHRDPSCNPYTVREFSLRHGADIATLLHALEDAQLPALRLKGFFRSKKEMQYLDWTPDGVNITPVAGEAQEGLVCIFPDEVASTIEDFLGSQAHLINEGLATAG